MEDLTVESHDGTEIHVHALGGSGRDVIICHATGFHGRAYEPMAREMSDDFRVWAIDFRGHGLSSHPVNDSFAWDNMAADLLAVVDALDISSLLAVGHSLGGGTILLTELARPGLIERAYLYEPIAFPEAYLIGRGVGENPMAGPARRRREVFPSREAALARYASRPPLNQLRADALHAYVEYGFVDLPDGTVQLACRAESEAQTFECEDKVTIERITGIDVDITVGAGLVDESPNVSDFAPILVDAVPSATLITYDLLGHFGPFEAPVTIGRAARDALLG